MLWMVSQADTRAPVLSASSMHFCTFAMRAGVNTASKVMAAMTEPGGGWKQAGRCNSTESGWLRQGLQLESGCLRQGLQLESEWLRQGLQLLSW